ncbi:MAG TPA: BREX-1 system adenine-specific DNA-methyltransferase PglX, partial [Leuconostoc citreum]|nr:BREX-1 system adenine-specific DNA-methyltransferase PglX [Leuconostoc citreum]
HLTSGRKNSLRQLLSVFSHGDSLGSIIEINQAIDFKELQKLTKSNLLINEDGFDAIEAGKMQQTLRNMLPVAKILSSRFTIAITNPPYMQASKMPKDLKAYVTSNYVDSKSDLFAVFIERLAKFVGSNGLYAMITQHQWMFLSSFERLRNKINKQSIINMAHLGTKAFEEIGGEVVQTTAFVMQNTQMSDYVGAFVRLVDYDSQKKKQAAYLNAVNSTESKDVYRTNQTNFSRLPGMPISYWISEKIISAFQNPLISEFGIVKSGIMVNSSFSRMWYELNVGKIQFNAEKIDDMDGYKWFPVNSGGGYRKWYGFNETVLNLEDGGRDIINDGRNYRLRDKKWYFKPGITWGRITSSDLSFRLSRQGNLFGDAGPMMFINRHIHFILGFSNSKVMKAMSEILNPTLNFQVEDMRNIPLILRHVDLIEKLVRTNVENSKVYWDAFERSWDFQVHPLIQHIDEHNRNWTLKEAFEEWKNEAQDRFDQLKDNEEELNRIFIDLYDLQDELTPDVEDKDVSVRTADEVRDVKSFLSYFVGLVFGRYSLDAPGLIYAGGDWEPGKYKSFQPNKDNVLILTDDSYFNDSRDIINRLKEFLRVTFGDENVQTNLEYIAQVIGKGGSTAEEKIRQYFIKDFYADHVSNYSKRPIYWEYNSGKKEGLRALMYSHRYDADTTGMIRTDYLLPLQEAYENALSNFESLVENETVVKTRKIYEKRVTRLTNQIDEMKMFDQVLQHLATARIEIDLDDGVIENHAKIQDGQKLLTKI